VKGAAAALILCLPTLAHAEGTSIQDYSFFSSFLQMIAALAIVVGLILLTRHFSGKFMGGVSTARFVSKHIRMVETRFIAPKKSLLLIEVGGEYLLLASTEDSITLVKKVNIIEDIEVLEENGIVSRGLAGLFRKSAGKQRG
jgi:flagellar protein FliO/FliZ